MWRNNIVCNDFIWIVNLHRNWMTRLEGIYAKDVLDVVDNYLFNHPEFGFNLQNEFTIIKSPFTICFNY